jgi:hypothetical protein
MTKVFLESINVNHKNKKLGYITLSKETLTILQKLKKKRVFNIMKTEKRSKTNLPVNKTRAIKTLDTNVIKEHLSSIDNEFIKKALIASGIYDTNMKLTASYK